MWNIECRISNVEVPVGCCGLHEFDHRHSIFDIRYSILVATGGLSGESSAEKFCPLARTGSAFQCLHDAINETGVAEKDKASDLAAVCSPFLDMPFNAAAQR